MKGRVLGITKETNSGVVSGEDNNRYTFELSEWKGDIPPVRGMSVDFDAVENTATAIYHAIGSETSTSKNKTTAGLLAIFLGWLGIHKFYLGMKGPGLVFLLVNTIGVTITWVMLFTPNYLLGIIAFIEGIIYLTKSDEELEQTYVIQKKKWF